MEKWSLETEKIHNHSMMIFSNSIILQPRDVGEIHKDKHY